MNLVIGPSLKQTTVLARFCDDNWLAYVVIALRKFPPLDVKYWFSHAHYERKESWTFSIKLEPTVYYFIHSQYLICSFTAPSAKLSITVMSPFVPF